VTKEGLPDAGKQDLMANLFFFGEPIQHGCCNVIILLNVVLASIVVWNPWDKKAKAMQDFGDAEYKSMLCVEPAAVERPITLKPGEEWKGRLVLSAVPSSYCSGQLDPLKVLQG
jgi:glucose-6-phosphate 1-epimerase